jgi:acyl-coenzyme A thioesterase PaaI-like protein
MEVVDVYENYARMRLPIENNRNHVGTMYASSILAVAEINGGSVMMSHIGKGIFEEFEPLIVGVDLNFRKIPRTDVYVELTVSKEKLENIPV